MNMSFLSETANTIDSSSREAWELAKKNVIAYLWKNVNTVRLFMPLESRNFGHQSATMNLFFRLAQLGTGGDGFNICYEGTSFDIEKLQLFLPFQGSPSMIEVTVAGEVYYITFTEWQGKRLTDTKLCLTGGYDSVISPGVFRNLSTPAFIEMEPFRFQENDSVNQIIVQGVEDDARYMLEEIIPHYNDLSFAIPIPTRDQSFWDQFSKLKKWKAKMATMESILDCYSDFGIDLCPVYGINTGSNNPVLNLYNLCSGLLDSQTRSGSGKRPAVILCFSKAPDEGGKLDYDLLQGLVATGDCSLLGLSPLSFPGFKTGWENLGSKNRIHILPSLPEAGQVVEAMRTMKGDEVLVVQIGPVPATVFNYCYSVAGVPFVFEGETTASLAFTLGKPYLISGSKNLYPTIPIEASTPDPIASKCLLVSQSLGASAMDWISIERNPAVVLGEFIFCSKTECPLTVYFKRVGAFFGDDHNDKLMRALDYLINIVWKWTPIKQADEAPALTVEALR